MIFLINFASSSNWERNIICGRAQLTIGCAGVHKCKSLAILERAILFHIEAIATV
jgi:hypothetical protein